MKRLKRWSATYALVVPAAGHGRSQAHCEQPVSSRFLYVCPEPVWAHRRVGSKNKAFSAPHRPPSERLAEMPPVACTITAPCFQVFFRPKIFKLKCKGLTWRFWGCGTKHRPHCRGQVGCYRAEPLMRHQLLRPCAQPIVKLRLSSRERVAPIAASKAGR